MIYLDLLIGFLKVGLFSFGGAYAAIPLIRDVVTAYGWMTDEELAYMIAVSESTPGPLMVNMATFVGSSQAGVLGAIIATTFVVLPAFVIILLVMALLQSALKNKYVEAAMTGLKSCVAGVILATGAYMMITRVVETDDGLKIDFMALFMTLILATLMFGSKKIFKKQISPILLIAISAVMGIVLL